MRRKIMNKEVIITIATVVLVGCVPKKLQKTKAIPIQQAEPLTAKALDISIHDSVREGNVLIFKKHIDAKTDLNLRDEEANTPLHNAALLGHVEIVKLLISNGAEINVKNGVGMTPLHEASNKEIAEILLANNANVNARAKGITPLHVAASVNDNDVSEILIINGADINAKDDSEITPLHYAVSFYAKEIVQLLITNGVDLNATDSDYKTALDYAEDFVQVNESANKAKVRIIIADLLRKHGAKTGEELKAAGN